LFALACSHEAVAEDAGAIPRPETGEVACERLVESPEILRPDVIGEPLELRGVESERLGGLLLDLRQRCRSDLSRTPERGDPLPRNGLLVGRRFGP
jgi:hypothetical protein